MVNEVPLEILSGTMKSTFKISLILKKWDNSQDKQ